MNDWACAGHPRSPTGVSGEVAVLLLLYYTALVLSSLAPKAETCAESWNHVSQNTEFQRQRHNVTNTALRSYPPLTLKTTVLEPIRQSSEFDRQACLYGSEIQTAAVLLRIHYTHYINFAQTQTW